MDIRTYLHFLNIAEKLKCNTRHSYTSSGRKESVAEHSWRLALMASLIGDDFPDVNMDKVICMCLFHDMGEAVTGDIPCFEKTDQDEKTEDIAVKRLLAELPEPCSGEVEQLFAEMGELQTKEAKLYKALDKLEALIQHNEADISTWIPLEYELQMTYGTKECEFSEYLKKLRDAVREDSKDKIKAADPKAGS